ncbi:MAG: hypothetical protein ACM339_04360 [Ignavibacteria bacterium]
MAKGKQTHKITWKEIKEAYGGLIWVGPGIVVVHELSHIIVGKGLNMQNGWYGLSVNGDITEAMYGIFGVYVNEVTPWTFAAGLTGSLLWIALMRRYGSLIRLHMTEQMFWAGLLYAVWIAKWDLKWLAGEILKVLTL